MSVVAALVLRWLLVHIQSNDYLDFVDPWYRHLAQTSSYTYNAPTPYAWLGDHAAIGWKYAGLGLVTAISSASGSG